MKWDKNIAIAFLWFALSTLLTGIFIFKQTMLYSSTQAMVLSGSIAGGKWLIQIVAAFILLKEKAGIFIRRIGFVCMTGSALLFVYYIFNLFFMQAGGLTPFVMSIALSVLLMICMYYNAVKQTGLSLKWWLLWLACLAIAIALQATIVF